jgi:hypothetical protein
MKPTDDCPKEHFIILLPVEDDEAITALLKKVESGGMK